MIQKIIAFAFLLGLASSMGSLWDEEISDDEMGELLWAISSPSEVTEEEFMGFMNLAAIETTTTTKKTVTDLTAQTPCN